MPWKLALALWSAALIAVLAQPAPAGRDGSRQTSLQQQELDAAFALHTAGQYPEAERQYRRAIDALQESEGPSHSLQDGRSSILRALTICAHNLAHINAEHLDNLEEARHWFKEASRIEPTYARAYYNLGLALLKKNHLEEAIQQFSYDILLRPDAVEPLLHTAAAYYELGQHHDASSHALRAVAASPSSASTLSSAGRLLLLAERYRAAEEVLRGGLQLEPSSAEMHLNIGRWVFCRDASTSLRKSQSKCSHVSCHSVIDGQGAI
jgi:tetratricopeptide (TPR) repeat protein